MLQPWEVYDQDLFDLEMLRVFGRSWVWLGDTEDLQQPGDYITGTIGAQPVVVVRTADGEIKGFLNNCRHRASQRGDRAGRQLRLVDDLPVPQLGVRPRRRSDRHPRPGAHVSRRASRWRSTASYRSASRWRGTSSCSAASRTRRRRSASGSHRSPIATTATGSTRSQRYPRQLDQTYPINWKAFVENSNDDYHVRFVHRRINAQRKSLDTHVRFDGPHVQRVQAAPRLVRHHRRPHRPRRGRAGTATTPTSSTRT